MHHLVHPEHSMFGGSIPNSSAELGPGFSDSTGWRSHWRARGTCISFSSTGTGGTASTVRIAPLSRRLERQAVSVMVHDKLDEPQNGRMRA